MNKTPHSEARVILVTMFLVASSCGLALACVKLLEYVR